MPVSVKDVPGRKPKKAHLEAFPVDDPRSPAEIFGDVAGLEHSCFLDSSLEAPGLGRHSFIGFDPYLVLATRGRAATFTHRDGSSRTLDCDPFEALGAALAAGAVTGEAAPSGAPPFTRGGIGYLSYELGRFIERLPGTAVKDIPIPELSFCFYDRVIACDLKTGEKTLFITAHPGRNPRPAAQAALSRIGGNPLPDGVGGPPLAGKGTRLDFESGFTREGYIEAVRRVKEYILAGDIYQANLSQRFSAPLLEPAWHLYGRLRRVNAAPFSAFLNFGDFAVASSSPERFLKLSGARVETRPIKGTRPRYDDPAADLQSRNELETSTKDLAELSMIVDLERNDLGRVCDYGSVKVEEHAVIESYATVHHLVSTVSGDLHRGKDVIDLLRATFPGGSITGAPKIRSMEIIDELEPTARSVYTGCIGYVGFDGNCDMNVAIRTMILSGRRVFFQVGGGIVSDSEPEAEYQETLDKGRALFESIVGAGADGGGA